MDRRTLQGLVLTGSAAWATPIAISPRQGKSPESGTPSADGSLTDTFSGNWTVIASPVNHTGSIESCPGYRATDVQTSSHGLTARLELAGPECHAFGAVDYANLTLLVNYDSANRLHVKIADADNIAPVIPEALLKYPETAPADVDESEAALRFEYVAEPFSFAVVRKSNNETLFNTTGTGPLVFEDQYVRVASSLPQDANMYGLGEHNDGLRLPTSNYSRTLWNRDAPGVPEYTPLYGSHPVYQEHRLTSEGPQTHGVSLMNAHGMHILLDNNTITYNVLGGILDFYFFAGPSPQQVIRDYITVIGKPTTSPYWGLGSHNCRYGYRDWFEVAAAVQNYSNAGIPLETAWTDIDLYDHRQVFTTSPSLFPRDLYRQVVDFVHSRDQHYIVMVDPAVAARDYGPYNRGVEQGVFMKNWNGDGTPFNGLVWPGRTVFPDWLAENTTSYWTNEFITFFGQSNTSSSDTIDIDGVWLDMSEPANFVDYLGANLDRLGVEKEAPPEPPTMRTPPYTIEGIPGTFPQGSNGSLVARQVLTYPDNPEEANFSSPWLYPPYSINDTRGRLGQFERDNPGVPKNLSDLTMRTDLIHADGSREYSVHNLFGLAFSKATKAAMQARRPGKKTFIINRATFAGSGRFSGHWLGDNLSTWRQMRQSVAQMLNFQMYGMPVVGADICGFGGNTTETLCARWAALAIFAPFYRNHNDIAGRPQEFYRFNLTTQSAIKTLDIRYRLLDAMYTTLHTAEQDGSPALEPLWYRWPADNNTFAIENQYLGLGGAVLVSPVYEENSTSVSAYLPNDRFYELDTWTPVDGNGTWVNFTDVPFDTVPLHLRGGVVLPMRSQSANVTKVLRTRDFTLVVAPARPARNATEGDAQGELYLDDGESLEPSETSLLNFTYTGAERRLTVDGKFGYSTDVKIDRILFLGQDASRQANFEGQSVASPNVTFANSTLSLSGLGLSLGSGFSVTLS
ncbi:hypothetical protein OC844_003052 [Tilletia horrida]|nr:hypothetical protein OC844_003052 [Tilletia horrida]